MLMPPCCHRTIMSKQPCTALLGIYARALLDACPYTDDRQGRQYLALLAMHMTRLSPCLHPPAARASGLVLASLAVPQKQALDTAQVCEALGMSELKDRKWHVQGAVAIRGEGLYEGLDW